MVRILSANNQFQSQAHERLFITGQYETLSVWLSRPGREALIS